MTDFEKLYNFDNLYKAHKAARLGKRDTRECIEFELNLGKNLTALSDSIKDGTYTLSGYYSFPVHDPKERIIHALHYRDRVVQHCLCDEILAPLLDKKLIYDNCACRVGKGTHFSLDRLSLFLGRHYKKHGTQGWFLRCDIHKFFDSIDHAVLKNKLAAVIKDSNIMAFLNKIIDSYEVTPGKGLPLGNQTSQWFALYYLDSFDRLIKEKLRIKFYTRYMDDCVLIHPDKTYLRECLVKMRTLLASDGLTFNEKTQIFPLKNGVDYLGWHVYLTGSGAVIRKVKRTTAKKLKRKLRLLEKAYAAYEIDLPDAKQILSSYRAHLAHGNAHRLYASAVRTFRLARGSLA